MPDTKSLKWGPKTGHRLLNTALKRVDGPAKATGVAIYAYDAKPPGMLFGALLLCPYAHAKVTSFDSSAALRIPGVKSVIQASANVRYEGTPVAAVAATTPEAADDALRAIKITYEQMPFVVTAEDALKPNAIRMFKEGNVRSGARRGVPEEVNNALSHCDAVIDVQYHTPRWHHCCLETHGNTVDYRGKDTATVWATTQSTFSIPGDAARALSLDRSNVTAIVQNMGGGFGSKFGIGRWGQLACQMSKQTGKPVKLMLTRTGEFLTAGNGPASWQKVKAGASKDGKLVAMYATQYALGGIGRGGVAGLPYIYHCDHKFSDESSIHTNEDSSCALRAPGHPQTSFVMESVMDELADKIGMDPVEFRKKNIHDKAWHRQLDMGVKEIGWERRNPKAGGGEGPIKRGMGCGIGTWGGGGNPQCVVTVNISKDGHVSTSVGTQDLGTGTRTYLRAIVAEELGREMDEVIEHIGNSNLGDANGSGGSTTAASLSPAVKDAAVNARLAMAKRVAPLLGVSADDVKFEVGKITGGEKSLSWKQACAALPSAGISAQGVWVPGLSSSGVHGACFAEVEVDVETGHIKVIKMVHIQDAGFPLNRLALKSQINGGMIQALSMALYEGRVMDRNLGVMANPEFGTYKLPGTLEMPELVPIIDDGDTRDEVIGIAESTNVAGVGAVANAVFNACGVRVRDLPITPDKILNGLA